MPPRAPGFSGDQVIESARALAKKPFVPPNGDLPSPYNKLSYEQYVGIQSKPGAAIWADEALGFAIEPLHRGFVFSAPVALNLVEDGQARHVAYDTGRFTFGGLQPPPNTPDLNYSGFRVLQSTGNGAKDWTQVAIFQGATFFRSLAKGQTFGVTARALSIRTADPKGEEFPIIREFWIEKPSPSTAALSIHALVDSESLTGAYHFTFRPGDLTLIDTECTLFTRGNPVDGLGLGTMAAMSYFGPIDRRGVDDLREGVYEIGGVQVLNGNGEWLWRPVSNRNTLQVSSFLNPNPRGFGVLQRERRFSGFEDDEQHWELRPSLWVEPLGDWGEGSVTLIEIPSDAEMNDNVLCFWRPKAPMAANAEAAFAYRQSWCWTPLQRPPLPVVSETRSGKGSAGKRRRFMVAFTGNDFADPDGVNGLQAVVTTSVGTIGGVRTFPLVQDQTVRVQFELDPGSETLAELRLLLQRDGKPASETWLYRWTA